MDPLSASLFTSIGSAFKFADVAVRIAEVGSENAVFVRAIQVVRSDLEEVERLLSQKSVQQKLVLIDGKIHWIKTAIKNTRNALNEIGRWVERARVEQESTGSIRFDTRVRWVFSDHEKLLNRKLELSTCHQQLSNVLGYLVGLEGAPVHTTLQESGDASYDVIVARHKRSIRPQVQNNNYDCELKEKGYGISEPPATDPVWGGSNRLPSASRYCSPPSTQVVTAYERKNTLRSPSLASTSSPPGSPPPTYENAVSVRSLQYGAQANTIRTNRAASASLVADRETASPSPHDQAWAYKSSPADSAIAELAGDTVVLSGTNSAGPVDPYELCDSPNTTTYRNTGRSQGLYAGLAELMGDLHISTEPIKNDPGISPEYPLRRQAFNQVGSTQNNSTGPRYRTMSDTAPVIRRRPISTHALSDSLLTVHDLPPLSAPGTAASTVPKIHPLSYARPSTPESQSGLPPHVCTVEQPSSYNTRQSQQDSRTPIPVPNRHYSAPPAPVAYSGHVAVTSAESTNSRAIGTQPKEPRTIPGLDSVKATRMQSQKRMMDLLSSIGT